jgi:hypothetical protein
MHLNRIEVGTLIHIYMTQALSWLGHVYVHGGSCHYSIKMYVPIQDNVWVMYMCMRIPATILFRIVAGSLIHIYIT